MSFGLEAGSDATRGPELDRKAAVGRLNPIRSWWVNQGLSPAISRPAFTRPYGRN